MSFSRRRELWLILCVFLIITLGYWVVWQAYRPAWQTLYHGADLKIFLAPLLLLPAWIVLSLALSARRCRETLIIPIVALLCGIGFLFILRIAGGTFSYASEKNGEYLFGLYNKQLLSFFIGWVVLLVVILGWKSYQSLSRYKYLVAFTAIALLILTTILGTSVNGQTVVLHLGPITFQPHDPVKMLLIIFMAAYLAEKRELINATLGKYGMLTRMDLRYLGPLLALWLFVMAIIFLHDDLGAALLLYGALLGMLYLGTGRKRYVVFGLLLSIISVVGGYQIAKAAHLSFVNRVDTRLQIWSDPWSEQNNKGYQISQALMAIGNGRVVGAGLAGGYPERIPLVETDMIYAAISEDLGLLGAVALLAIYLALIYRIFAVALRTENQFGKLLTAGLALSLAIHTWVIIAGVTKLIPLTGITLPFISYGGTSLFVNLLLICIVMKVDETVV